jgi:hypothetical protein
MVLFLGDVSIVEGWNTATTVAERDAVLRPFRNVSFWQLQRKHCSNVFQSSRRLVLISALLPKVGKLVHHLWLGFRKSARAAPPPPRDGTHNACQVAQLAEAGAGADQLPPAQLHLADEADAKSKSGSGGNVVRQRSVCADLYELILSMAMSYSRTTLSVLAMPFGFWVGMWITLRLPLPLRTSKFVMASLPMFAGLAALAVEGKRKASLFALFMLYTAVK